MDDSVYRHLFEQSSVGLAVNRMSDGEFLSVNQSFAEIVSYTLEELNHLSYWDLTPKKYAADEEAQLKSLEETGRYGPYEKHYIDKHGVLVPVRLNGCKVITANNEVLILSSVEDMSAQADFKEKLMLSSLIMDNSSEGMMILNEQYHVIFMNPASMNILGPSSSDMIDSFPGFLNGDTDIAHKLETTGRWEGELWHQHEDDKKIALKICMDVIKNNDGDIRRVSLIFSDITAAKERQEALWHHANFDLLTGLANRNQLQEKLDTIIKQAKTANLKFSILLLDLDEFKDVNDTLGHNVGDHLLAQVGERLKNTLSQEELIVRYGGDEFIILILNIDDKDTLNAIADKIIKTISKPYNINEQEIYISGSIGVSRYPLDATDAENLLKYADQAMYLAKNGGKNHYRYFNLDLQEDAQHKRQLSNELRSAIDKNELHLVFQPIYDIATQTFTKAEALLRWNNRQFGMITPEEFIPICEKIGMIHLFTDWVVNQVTSWINGWMQEEDVDIKICINFSPSQLLHKHDVFWQQLVDFISAANIGHHLVFEFTEETLLHPKKHVHDKLNVFDKLGIEIAIDDFGSGYSSLNYLKDFNIDYLKIDKNFLMDLDTNPTIKELYKAMINMAHALNLKVIAEGVETDEQDEFLKAVGCDYIQGFHYARPIKLAEFQKLLLAQKQRDA